MRGAWFKDPEGNILSVVQPSAAWSTGERLRPPTAGAPPCTVGWGLRPA